MFTDEEVGTYTTKIMESLSVIIQKNHVRKANPLRIVVDHHDIMNHISYVEMADCRTITFYNQQRFVRCFIIGELPDQDMIKRLRDINVEIYHVRMIGTFDALMSDAEKGVIDAEKVRPAGSKPITKEQSEKLSRLFDW